MVDFQIPINDYPGNLICQADQEFRFFGQVIFAFLLFVHSAGSSALCFANHEGSEQDKREQEDDCVGQKSKQTENHHMMLRSEHYVIAETYE